MKMVRELKQRVGEGFGAVYVPPFLVIKVFVREEVGCDVGVYLKQD